MTSLYQGSIDGQHAHRCNFGAVELFQTQSVELTQHGPTPTSATRPNNLTAAEHWSGKLPVVSEILSPQLRFFFCWTSLAGKTN